MQTYELTYYETYIDTYEIEANSIEEAERILQEGMMYGDYEGPDQCEDSGFIRNDDENVAKHWFTNTSDLQDKVQIWDVFKRYVEINGTYRGFEAYVDSGFVNGNEVEYQETPY